MKRVSLAVILSSICFVVLGTILLYSRYTFYKQSKIIPAVITKIDEPSFCNGRRGCYLSQQVFFVFKDPDGKTVTSDKEISTVTLVSALLTQGSGIKVLYKPVEQNYLFYIMVKNLGPKAHTVQVYTWHYWLYPILTILCGPLLYFIYIKRFKKTINA